MVEDGLFDEMGGEDEGVRALFKQMDLIDQMVALTRKIPRPVLEPAERRSVREELASLIDPYLEALEISVRYVHMEELPTEEMEKFLQISDLAERLLTLSRLCDISEIDGCDLSERINRGMLGITAGKKRLEEMSEDQLWYRYGRRMEVEDLREGSLGPN